MSLAFGGPNKRLWFPVVLGDVFLQGAHQFWHTVEGAASQPVHRQVAEEALHHVEPRGAGGREVEMKTRVLPEPLLHLRVFMGGIVAQDQMQVTFRRSLSVNELQKRQSFLMVMTILTLPDQGSIGYVEWRKERSGTMTHIVMSHRSRTPFLQGQAWLRTIEGLNLTFLITVEYDGVFWGVEKADDIFELLGKSGSLETVKVRTK